MTRKDCGDPLERRVYRRTHTHDDNQTQNKALSSELFLLGAVCCGAGEAGCDGGGGAMGYCRRNKID